MPFFFKNIYIVQALVTTLSFPHSITTPNKMACLDRTNKPFNQKKNVHKRTFWKKSLYLLTRGKTHVRFLSVEITQAGGYPFNYIIPLQNKELWALKSGLIGLTCVKQWIEKKWKRRFDRHIMFFADGKTRIQSNEQIDRFLCMLREPTKLINQTVRIFVRPDHTSFPPTNPFPSRVRYLSVEMMLSNFKKQGGYLHVMLIRLKEDWLKKLPSRHSGYMCVQLWIQKEIRKRLHGRQVCYPPSEMVFVADQTPIDNETQIERLLCLLRGRVEYACGDIVRLILRPITDW